ncbi:hypothetical protein EDB29_101639 [Vibrio crassostreae]|nr:hypothetical protein EDB29_101639 [Vibrio crassostreae]
MLIRSELGTFELESATGKNSAREVSGQLRVTPPNQQGSGQE